MSVERSKYNPEVVKPESSSEIKNEEIEYLELPIYKILVELKDKIKDGDYGTIIGDDASGRIPTLIINKFLKSYYSKHGLGNVETLFLAGSGHYDKSERETSWKINEILKYLIKSELDEKDVLIVTDTISSGNSLHPLTAALRKMRKKYDIASVGNQFVDENSIGEYLGTKPIYGELGVPPIYFTNKLSGVRKSAGDLFARRKKDVFLGTDGGLTQRRVNQARSDAAQVAVNLLEKFEELE